MNDVGREDKIMYPCLHGINPDTFPALKQMRLGDTGEAAIRYKISDSGGIDVLEIKHIGVADPKAEKDRKTLIKRHKKNSPQQNDPTADADSGGGYSGGI